MMILAIHRQRDEVLHSDGIHICLSPTIYNLVHSYKDTSSTTQNIASSIQKTAKELISKTLSEIIVVLIQIIRFKVLPNTQHSHMKGLYQIIPKQIDCHMTR
jgi:hypothetical protein